MNAYEVERKNLFKELSKYEQVAPNGGSASRCDDQTDCFSWPANVNCPFGGYPAPYVVADFLLQCCCGGDDFGW